MSNCILAWPATTPESVSWNCKIICFISIIVIKTLMLHFLAGSPRNMSVFVLIMWPTIWKQRTGGAGYYLLLMIPSSARFTTITTAICTIVWPICVASMAASSRIRSMALRLIFSLRRGRANFGWRRQLQSWGGCIVLVVYIADAADHLFRSMPGISCSWSWIRWFVHSWSSTLRCRYGTPPAKGPLINCLMPKSICK